MAVVTFNEIQLDVNRRLNFNDSPAAAVTTRLNTFINQRHRQILSMPGIDRLRDDNTTFASVASQATYAMGPSISRIKTIYDGTTNQMKLVERTLQWLRTADPRLASTGTPEAWIPLSIKQVQAQPAAACNLHVISTSASDTGTCYVEYTRTGNYRSSASATMTGSVDKALTTTTDVIRADKFYLSAVAVGTVTLLDAAGGTVLATIPPGQSYGRYIWMQLWPTPSGVVTYNVDYTREIYDMANAFDEPLLPPDFHYLLSVGARIDEYEKMDDDRRKLAYGEWQLGISRLRNYLINSPDYVIVPGGRTQSASNLGPYYPAGSGW
jgi:hypothetical protein